MDELTVGDHLASLLPRLMDAERREIPQWPPDVFGLLASLVQRAGLYGLVLRSGPAAANYAETCGTHSRSWRSAIEHDAAVPAEVVSLWTDITGIWDVSCIRLRECDKELQPILQLMAIADECGKGLGGAFGSSGFDRYEDTAAQRLARDQFGSTLCDEIHPSRLRVLPKRRTPPSGLNIRSLSLYLSCASGNEILPQWTPHVGVGLSEEILNVVVVPYPFQVDPLWFQPVSAESHEMPTMDRRWFGFFTVNRPEDKGVALRVAEQAVAAAEKSVGIVHILLFPETALLPGEYAEVARFARTKGITLLAGVGKPAVNQRAAGTNAVQICLPTGTEIQQHKHHRWRLDRPQILRYELGATLNPSRDWWEYIAIDDRKQHFLQVSDWLLLAPLICEDLARPDPAGDLVRAVGPDLVIAFLMDGPQLATRWPARYATVLADDPGCSVLTITSLGMALRSCPPGGAPVSRRVLSWKDPVSGPQCLDAPDDSPGAAVLTLNKDTRMGAGYRSIAADGRVNRVSGGYPILSRLQWLKLG